MMKILRYKYYNKRITRDNANVQSHDQEKRPILQALAIRSLLEFYLLLIDGTLYLLNGLFIILSDVIV